VQSESLQDVAGYGWDAARSWMCDYSEFDSEFGEGSAAFVLEALGHIVCGERDAGEDEFIELTLRSGHEIDKMVGF
jgi:hypothetical protein